MDYVLLAKVRKKREMMKVYGAVGLGGVLGSCLRYLFSLVMSSNNFTSFPWATLVVNISGTFLLPFILFLPMIKRKVNPVILVALTTGLIGSYTTFSTITVEIVMMFHENILVAIGYLISTLIGGLLFSWLGYQTALFVQKGGSSI